MKGGITMVRHPVSSSRIANLGWENNVLEIQFHNGKIYQYYDVTVDEYNAFMSSPSLGSALSKLDKVHTYKPIN